MSENNWLPDLTSDDIETWAVRLNHRSPLQARPERRLQLRFSIFSPVTFWYRDNNSITKLNDLHLIEINGHSNSLDRPHVSIQCPIQIITHHLNNPLILPLLPKPYNSKTPAHHLFELKPSLANRGHEQRVSGRQLVCILLFFLSKQRVAVVVVSLFGRNFLQR